MRKSLLNKILFSVLTVLGSALIGLIIGLIAYGISLLTMPWLTAKQMNTIIPWFVFTGVILGLFAVWYNRGR